MLERRGDRQTYSDARVAELLAEYQRTGDGRIRDAVVEHMRPLVRSIARKFAGREPLEDLESEGYVGLVRAVDRYTPGRGTRFSTFATHLIAGQIRHYLRDRGHLIRQPAWLQELNSKVQRISAELEQRLHRPPTVEEIARAANISEEGVEELFAARQAVQVLRMETRSDDGDDDFMEVDPEKFRSRDYVTFELPIEDRVMLENALCKLKDLEQQVLRRFFFQDNNQSEIARALGISVNYAGYVLRNGLKHMRERLPHERITAGHPNDVPPDETVLDESTGLYGKEYFDRRLNEEISRAQREGQSVSVCCLQLPADCPEDVVREAAQTLRRRIRKADVPSRTGHREFTVILPNTGTVAGQVAVRLAEHLHQIIGGPVHAASATFPDSGRTAQDLFSAARTAAFPSPRLVAATALE